MNFVIEVVFLLLCSDMPNFQAHAGLLWKSLGDDKDVSGEVFGATRYAVAHGGLPWQSPSPHAKRIS